MRVITLYSHIIFTKQILLNRSLFSIFAESFIWQYLLKNTDNQVKIVWYLISSKKYAPFWNYTIFQTYLKN